MLKLRYIFLLLLCLCLTSCAPMVFLGGAAAGVGGYKYIEGALTVIYEAPYENTWNASLKALEDMGFTIDKKTEQLGSGKVSTKADANNKEVTVSVNYKSAQDTEVKIRVGLFGDENASNLIKDKITSILFRK